MQSLEEFKKIFDPLLEEFFNGKLENFNTLTSDNFIKEFVSYSKTLTLASGKRLRPYLAFLTYKAYGGKNEREALELFVSLEVFHMFALVHDDIMDRANTRHGEKAMHKFILEKLEEKQGFGDLAHVANSQAILVGDLLQSWALENFHNRNNFEKDNFKKIRVYFYKMIDEVILGQMLDVDIATKENVSEDLINEKTRLKTSRYSCVRPMQIGAALANSAYGQEEFLEELGTKVGIAFQMQDDLLDIIGDSKKLTKDTLNDTQAHQHTFYTHYIFGKGGTEYKKELEKYFGRKLTEDDKEFVKKLFIKSGAIDAGKKIILQMLNEARNLIDKSDLGDEYKDKLKELLEIMEKRQV